MAALAPPPSCRPSIRQSSSSLRVCGWVLVVTWCCELLGHSAIPVEVSVSAFSLVEIMQNVTWVPHGYGDGYTLKRRSKPGNMRVVGDDGREVIATDEELTTIAQLQVVLANAQHLNVSFNALTSLHGIASATQLRNLNVSHNALTSLRGVECLTQLQLLRCHGNQISDLSWVASLPSLRELWIHENQVEMAQIAHFATVSTLQTLVLHPNPCTNTVNYVSYVVKSVPWLTRVDLVEVDEPLRQQSQHVDEREFLSSAATDVSEISLMTSRSDGSTLEEPEQGITPPTKEVVQPIDPTLLATKTPSSTLSVPVVQKKTKKPKMTAEDVMRAFPVQDFITADDSTGQPPSESGLPHNIEPIVYYPEPPPPDAAYISNQVEELAIHEDVSSKATKDRPASVQPETSSISAIASAVMALPLFDGDGVLAQKKKPSGSALNNGKTTKKTGSSKAINATTTRLPDPALASFQQQEWTLAYPNSTVNAIQIRSDGSALAKWPNGSVAVSIDRERDGFRCYAAHKDGTIALSFDADGVGFINYYPSGRMMISTSSSGDGLLFSSDGSTILRQWDAGLNMKDEKWAAAEKLSDDTADGSLVAKLSDGLGVKFQLQKREDSTRPSAICLQICFVAGLPVMGKELAKQKKQASHTPAPTHSDTLHGIRAAVAKLG